MRTQGGHASLLIALLMGLFITLGVSTVAIDTAYAAPASDLRGLLHQVRQYSKEQATKDKERVDAFRTAKDEQQKALSTLNSKLEAAKTEGKALATQFDANEAELGKLESKLKEQSGGMTEVSSIARLTATELAGIFDDSLISAQYPGRSQKLREIAATKGVPSLDQLETLWLSLQQEMTETAASVRFSAEVVSATGEKYQTTVSRIGAFTAVADGKYLQWQADSSTLNELTRQPAGTLATNVANWEQSSASVADIAVDPTRGSVLTLLTRVPDWKERLSQGGIVGYIILAIGALGVLIALWRLISLMLVNGKVKSQLADANTPTDNNPLGRVLQAVDLEQSPSKEMLETSLDEAIIRETPPLERGKTAIKLLAAIAPMLGLLGTIVGMIATFQSISLFGTSDPKLMADGISQALMTTLMGLGVAIPLLLLHSVLLTKSRSLIQILDEQSAGLVARALEGAK